VIGRAFGGAPLCCAGKTVQLTLLYVSVGHLVPHLLPDCRRCRSGHGQLRAGI